MSKLKKELNEAKDDLALLGMVILFVLIALGFLY